MVAHHGLHLVLQLFGLAGILLEQLACLRLPGAQIILALQRVLTQLSDLLAHLLEIQ
jgi:hypothetical protein